MDHFCSNIINFTLPLPEILLKISNDLSQKGVKTIVVGGYVRDAFIGQQLSKDIDIEVYNVQSYEKLVTLLQPYGKPNVVGASFGVCKLTIGQYQYDFSLPRKESKQAKGHKGFAITIDTSLNFKEAARRRDFTINTLGYDPLNNHLLDPFNGIDHLQNKLLEVVDSKSFVDDPLRFYRAGMFIGRFELHPTQNLLKLSKEILTSKELLTLPKERVFEEFKKLFLQSNKPSLGIDFFKEVDENLYLTELFELPQQIYEYTLDTLDRAASSYIKELTTYFTLLFYHLRDPSVSLERFTNSKNFIQKVIKTIEDIQTLYKLLYNSYTPFDLKMLAVSINLDYTLKLLQILYPKQNDGIAKLYNDAKKLGVLYQPIPQIITGKDLIAYGLKPSKDFKKILELLYEKQLQGEDVRKEKLEELLKSINSVL